ncbi:ABC transporter ATP-binding protein [Halostella sp. PRR32]|uniref:ABC transporter ATP-binding protein n=1 Tax=Halostella sp. PRR32 TaxID=3098147 RepID=UPI002B1E17E3|nr:ABC transporter ATP-binding protein [Halostella sp. PRR32]
MPPKARPDTNTEQMTDADTDPTTESDTATRLTGIGTPAVAVEGLRKAYGDGEDAVTAVDNVSFSVEPGTVVGLLGPNGAGKTTTIKSLLGLIVPTEGSARICGVDVHDRPAEAYRHVGAMLEGARNVYWRLTVRENLWFYAALAGRRPSAVRERHDELLEQFALTEKADTAVRELSRGMKQKVSLACTLARDGDVVFLDEPTLGLDVESSLELRSELRTLADDEGMTVLLSSHDMDVIEAVCDRVIIMSEGSIVADDTVEDLLDLFRTQAYEMQVSGTLSDETRTRLEREFDADGFDRRGDRERFVAAVTGDEFYALTDALRESGHTVASVDAVDPDLEEVFLRITENGGDES